MSWLLDHYLLLKSIHIIGVIAWMAGLLYLPRLYVYHLEAGQGSEIAQTFQTMERRLYRGIMMPSLIIAVIPGLTLLLMPGIVSWSSGWLHVKLFLVALLIAFHFFLGHCRKRLIQNDCHYSSRFFRMVNEIPAIAMIIIVVCVVIKPF